MIAQWLGILHAWIPLTSTSTHKRMLRRSSCKMHVISLRSEQVLTNLKGLQVSFYLGGFELE
jgi:hypothetical protein